MGCYSTVLRAEIALAGDSGRLKPTLLDSFDVVFDLLVGGLDV